MPDSIACHLTKSEQIALCRALTAVECRGRAEREQKAEAFEELGLDWVRETQEKPVQDRISADDVVVFYRKLREGGGDELAAMSRVMTLVQAVVQGDPFAGERVGQVAVSLSPRLLAWVLEKLDKAAPCGADDLQIAAVEARLRLAERGGYVAPEASKSGPNHDAAAATA